MKKSLLLLCCLLLSISAVSQTVKADVIIKRDNTKMEVIIQEINNSTIKYTRLSSPTRPVFTIEKSEVVSILYANGEVDSFENILPNIDLQLALSAVPKNLFEERIRWESDRELKKMYILEKSHIKNRIVSGSIFMGLSGIGVSTAIGLSPSPNYYFNPNVALLGTFVFGTIGALKFINLKKHQSRKKAIEEEFLRRTIDPKSFTFQIQTRYDPLLHAPTITLRARF